MDEHQPPLTTRATRRILGFPSPQPRRSLPDRGELRRRESSTHPGRGPGRASRARSKRLAASLALATALAAAGLGAMGMADSPLTTTAVAASSSASVRNGEGIAFTDSHGDWHWLGALNTPGSPGMMWCIEFGPEPPDTALEMSNAREIAASERRGDVAPELAVAPAQMAWLLTRYESTNTATSRAALSTLVHANFDITATAAQIVAEIGQKYPEVYAQATDYASQARTWTPQSFSAGSRTNEAATRTGTLSDIALTNEAGALLAGLPVTVTLDGPAVFDATGTATWSGTTAATPLTLPWTATGNGPVTWSMSFSGGPGSVTHHANHSGAQDTLRHDRSRGTEIVRPGDPFNAYYDFAPIATSDVSAAESKVLDRNTTMLRDTLQVRADESYSLSPMWMNGADGQPVPVTFEGIAYDLGSLPLAAPGEVPPTPREIGRTTITAVGPGEYTAQIPVKDVDPNFVTWVWRVRKDAQGEFASYIGREWSDSYGLAEETTSVRERVKIVSAIQSNVTRAGTYLVDNLYVSGFDADHPGFAGGAGFGPDMATMEHTLYFFPADLEVSEANKGSAQVVGSVRVPAKNGYVDRVGSGDFALLEGNPPGTYVFVTSFAGDDRTEPYTTPVDDPYEQFVVEENPPEIHTTATDQSDGDKQLADGGDVTIVDKVCQVQDKGLRPGKTYTLTATAMDKASGKPFLNEKGEPFTGTVEFTPADEEDCATVPVTIPSRLLRDTSVVMFENVALEGRTVALHTDINDEGQTVRGPDTPPPPPLARTGLDVFGAAIAAVGLTIAGGVVLLRRRSSSEPSQSQS